MISVLHGAITRNTTLEDLKHLVANHLGVPIPEKVQPGAECNCSFARQIDERALLNEAISQDTENKSSSSTLKFIVVHGNSQVCILETEAVDRSSLLENVRQSLGVFGPKEIGFIGGALLPNSRCAFDPAASF